MAKRVKKSVPTPVEDYGMQEEYKRPTIMTGEMSGMPPEDVVGRPMPKVSYDLKGQSSANLEKEFAERDPDLDPQYIWRGKVKNDINTLETAAPFIYQQEKIFPRMLIEEMKRQTAIRRNEADSQMDFGDLSEDFDPNAKPCFYNHEEGWKNRMILGDSLQVMASLAENERLRGKVQMIYFDPPYGIKFNSNWQPSTKSTNVKDGAVTDITREPEMVKAFRDTWHDGIHSYLGYLRDRLTVARDLLAETGSVFVQIGDANVHKVRAIMEEVLGEENFVSQISYVSTSGLGGERLSNATNYLIWFAREKTKVKWRPLYKQMELSEESMGSYKFLELKTGEKISQADFKKMFGHEFTVSDIAEQNCRLMASSDLTSANHGMGVSAGGFSEFEYNGRKYNPGKRTFTTHEQGMTRIAHANRIYINQAEGIRYARFFSDFGVSPINNVWTDTGTGSFTANKIYVCQTSVKLIQRCMLMCTDPGDLVLDPTCGSGTTAFVAEQWGRRWITIDTSRVAIALARRRIMTAKYPYYLLADSQAGLEKEMKVTGRVIQRPTFNKISQGFVYERVPHITLKAIANNSEIDTIWEKYEAESDTLRNCFHSKTGIGGAECNHVTPEWMMPLDPQPDWDETTKSIHAKFVELKHKRQAEIDASIARTAETEYLYDKPYEDKKRVRVAGPFTVESVAPVRALVGEADGSFSDPALKLARDVDYGNGANYVTRMIRALRKNGVKQARKGDRITFTNVEPWANGKYIAAAANGEAGDNAKSKRYAIAFGPEFGSVTRLDMKTAAREALECGFDVLIYCAFNFEAYVEEGSDTAMGRLKVLQARMNSDLHMTTDLKDTGHGNPFVIFGEPDIAVTHTEDDLFTVTIKGVDVYDPKKDEVRSDNADAIDCWMLDTDYSGEAFFARQVYFPGREDVYKAFKMFLKNDIDEEEWESVSKTESRPFARPQSGQIAVKVINHFGDEVMKVFEVK